MKSIKSIYKIGFGPSSSHTMGPSFATKDFLKLYSEADFIKVLLYGSLAKTGKGHGTDRAISETLANIPHEIVFDYESKTPIHPNTLEFIAFKEGKETDKKEFYSIGGGEIQFDGADSVSPKEVYSENNFTEIANVCKPP